MGEDNKAVYLAKLYNKMTDGLGFELSDGDLKLVIAHTADKRHLEIAKFELERRQTLKVVQEMRETTKMQKWVAISTGVLAIVTVILAVITWFK